MAPGRARAGNARLSALHDTGGALAGLLESIDDDKLRQVVRLVEASGQRRILEPALAALRPRLRQLRPRRRLTLTRLLAVPLAPVFDGPVFDGAVFGGASGPRWPFSIARERLGDWQQHLARHLDAAVAEAAGTAIEGQAADDAPAILAAGRIYWPEAAAVLAREALPGETEPIAIERGRIADLLAIADRLVPLLDRLPARVTMDDEVERATVSAIFALTPAGPPDRLGVLAALLLRRARWPADAVPWLIELAPMVSRGRLRPLLARLVTEHRAGLARWVADLGADQDLPLEAAVDAFAQLADALQSPAEAKSAKALAGKPRAGRARAVEAPAEHVRPGEVRAGELRAGAVLGRSLEKAGASGDEEELRLTAATLAQERYAHSLGRVLQPLPPVDAAERAAAVKAREDVARRLAKLGGTVKRLCKAVPIHQLTEATIERLVDLDARRQSEARHQGGVQYRGGVGHRGGEGALVTVEDARLVEILAGPDLAWLYLRPTAGARHPATNAATPDNRMAAATPIRQGRALPPVTALDDRRSIERNAAAGRNEAAERTGRAG